MAAEIIARLRDPQFGRWAGQIRRTGGCRQPIHMRGHVLYIDPATGKRIHSYTTATEPYGTLRLPCKTRRASRCPSCAETYRADTYQLIRAGLAGGKGVPTSVTTHPALFVTLTAPSFGSVHTRRQRHGKLLPCRPRRNAQSCPHGRSTTCSTRHSINDPRLGEPLCPDCYNYSAAVLFNAIAPELWRRFTEALRRRFAKTAGLTLRELRDHVRISFAKVAEYQRRGVVHFHAVIRLDGPDGPTTPPPPWATADALADAVQHAAGAVSVIIPTVVRPFRWGRQLDIRPITTTGDLTEQAVASYIAKYATKASECVGTLDRRISPAEDLTALPIRNHARRLIAECMRLGQLDDLADLRLIQWAHMLGFRGHFATKSRAYSLTRKDLHTQRIDHERAEAITTGRLPLFDHDTVLVISHWVYVGKGLSRADQIIAAALSGGSG
ncbi:replication initiator [Nonomuraea sp. NPDC050310]|uniref:replication initiator n=1 Tax=Nonomuraea sp. NPDC050310 TaxID=3154935 RepID=UPI0033FDA994